MYQLVRVACGTQPVSARNAGQFSAQLGLLVTPAVPFTYTPIKS